MEELEVVVGHESLNFLENLHFTGVAEVVGLILNNSLYGILFVFEYIRCDLRIQLELLQKVLQNGLRAQLKTTITMFENNFDDFLEHSLAVVFGDLKLREHGVLGGQNLQQPLYKAVVEEFGIL